MNSLEHAVVCDDHARVKTLLAKGADPNLKNRNGQTALQLATVLGHFDVYKTLLPVTHQPDWDSLLQEFSRSGWKDQVKVAVVNGANLNNRDSVGDTPLVKAAKAGHHAIVETLLTNGANPNIPGCTDYTPLHHAARAGHHAIVKTLLDKGAEADLKDMEGWTPLQFAAENRHRDVYDTLLPETHQPDWNSLLPKLIYAGWHNQFNTALDNGANPNILVDYHSTPLHWAAGLGHHAMVKILLKKGADPNLRDGDGWSALQAAVYWGHLDVYKTLLPETRQPDWNRLLPIFSCLGWKDQIKEALVNGADPNIPLDTGTDPYISVSYHLNTLLHLAAGAGQRDIVETLLVNGADPKLKNKNGLTACQCASVEPIKEAIRNFMSVPHSLQFYCRASIRSRLIK
uniref:ankyrin repeat domain-containing protein n=1 Tax=Endozoicomonas sp. ONNA2 TaxID=2828741 RepID=UPI0021495D3B